MSNQDNLTDRLGRELHDRGASVPGHPIGLDDVKKTAGKIRRRRQVAAGAVVAAAAAIIVPSVMVAGNLLGGDAGPDPVPAPSVTRTPEPAPVDGPIVLEADAPQGADPQLQYLDGRTLVDSAGNEIQLSADYNYVARVGDEFLAVRQGDPGTFVDVLDAEGTVIDTSQTTAEAVSSADHTVGAWITPNGDILSRFEGRTVRLGSAGGPAQAVEIRGNGSCMEVEGGCVVYFNHQDADSPPQLASSHGIVDIVGGGFQNVRAVSERGLIAGLVTKPDPDPAAPACSAVYDAETDARLFKTCDYVFEYAGSGFSPDESRIVAYAQDADGAGPRSVVLLDTRTGDTVAEIEVSGADLPGAQSIVDTAWEDGGTLLVKAEGMNADGIPAYNLFRVDLADGTVERVLQRDNTSGGEVQPWVFLD